MSKEAVIVATARTPIGKAYRGAFNDTDAPSLGGHAIAAAVLGGCSLRGGQGTILGVVIGAALMQILRNMITLVDWIPTHIEYAVIGSVILVGVVADEIVKRVAAARKAAASRN